MVDNRDWGVVQPFKDIYLSKLSRLVTFHGTIVLRGHKNVSKLVWNKMNIEKSSSINLLQNYRHIELFEKHSEEEKQGDFGKHTVLILPKCFHKKTRTTLRKLIPNLHM